MNKDTEHIKYKLQAIHDDVGEISEDIHELKKDVKDHIGRIGKAEADISWLKGHVKLVTTMVITIVGYVITYYFSIK